MKVDEYDDKWMIYDDDEYNDDNELYNDEWWYKWNDDDNNEYIHKKMIENNCNELWLGLNDIENENNCIFGLVGLKNIGNTCFMMGLNMF